MRNYQLCQETSGIETMERTNHGAIEHRKEPFCILFEYSPSDVFLEIQDQNRKHHHDGDT